MPFCTMLLADMGARVIKVESLEQARERLSLGMKRVRNGVEERVPVYQYSDRNKQAITPAIPGQKSASNMLEQWNFGTMPLSLPVKARVVGG